MDQQHYFEIERCGVKVGKRFPPRTPARHRTSAQVYLCGLLFVVVVPVHCVLLVPTQGESGEDVARIRHV